MIRATVAIDPRRRRGTINDQVYGQMLEQLGRAIYGGVFEPGSPLSDEQGYRLDVIDAARGLRPTLLRWPGGNFVSGYHWRDGIGPVGGRPLRRDLAWNALESNTFGTEEFLELAVRLGAAPYLNLNLSTGTIDEALGWLDYCNAREPLPEAELRRRGPHPEPHDVLVWGLGNENYGWWQHLHTTADRYAEQAREWAKLLKWTDPRISLVAVGAPEPDWNWAVLRQVSRFVEHLSMHFYWFGRGDDPYLATLAGPIASEADIVATYGMAVAAQRELGLRRPVTLAVDEWGVWSRSTVSSLEGVDLNSLMLTGLTSRAGIDTHFEEAYDLKDALTIACWLHVLWRHPEKVTLATQSQMVNVIAPLLTHPDGVVRRTVYWPLAAARAVAGPVALDPLVLCEAEVGVGGATGVPGDAMPSLDAAATLHPDTGAVHVSLVNRSRDEELEVLLEGVRGDAWCSTLAADDPFDGNSLEHPDRVRPVEIVATVDDRLVLQPASHTTLLFGASTTWPFLPRGGA